MSFEGMTEDFMRRLQRRWESTRGPDGFAHLGDCVVRVCREMHIEPSDGQYAIEAALDYGVYGIELSNSSPRPLRHRRTVRWRSSGKRFVSDGMPVKDRWYRMFRFHALGETPPGKEDGCP